MTQTRLRLKGNRAEANALPEFAEAIGLSSKDELVSLQFISNATWGGATRMIYMDRRLAEQLTRLLNDELDDGAWSLAESAE